MSVKESDRSSFGFWNAFSRRRLERSDRKNAAFKRTMTSVTCSRVLLCFLQTVLFFFAVE